MCDMNWPNKHVGVEMEMSASPTLYQIHKMSSVQKDLG